jgi:hypothetical protein
MAYSQRLAKAINSATTTEGNNLGRLALNLDFSVARIAKATGATRQTIYNWFVGGKVAPYYRSAVEELISILAKSNTADNAWRTVCQHFGLRT